jgi:hypothetical protein
MSKQIKVAKALAKQITAALSENGQTLAHSVALEVVAKAMGARTWHAFLSEQQAAVKAETAAVTPPAWSPAQGPMTDEQYARARGCRCPLCGHRNSVEGGSVEVDGEQAWCKVECSNCGGSWNDYFTLTGWGDAERGDGIKTKSAAKEIGFLYAVQLWLRDKDEEFDEDQQSILDDLVVDACSEESMDGVNAADGPKDREAAIQDAESKASDINNNGMISQLAYLLEGFSSREEFIDFLAEKFETNPDTLKL